MNKITVVILQKVSTIFVQNPLWNVTEINLAIEQGVVAAYKVLSIFSVPADCWA